MKDINKHIDTVKDAISELRFCRENVPGTFRKEIDNLIDRMYTLELELEMELDDDE